MRIENRPDLARFSTLGLGGLGRAVYYPETIGDLEEISRVESGMWGSCMFLGAGSNILFAPGEHDLGLVRWQGGQGISARDLDEGGVVLRVDGGVRLPRVLGWCAARGIAGLEPLAGIPGTVGGAVAMNAGSHGTQICDLLAGIRVWSEENGEEDIEPRQIKTGYREMRVENLSRFLVTLVRLRLKKSTPARVKRETKRWFARKRAVQPVLEKTAGCVFKNMQGESTGKILERLGFKGKCRGGVCFSELHANFLVRRGGGTSEQALELIDSARQAIKQETGTEPETEIRIKPCP